MHFSCSSLQRAFLVSLSQRIINFKVIHFFKILNYETLTYLNNIVDTYNDHNIGNSLKYNNLRYPVPKTTSFQKSYFPATIDLWNNLDPKLANCTSLYAFKRGLKSNSLIPKTIMFRVAEKIISL